MMFNGNVEELPIYSQKVTNALNLLKQKMENIGCKSLFCTGDRVVLDVWMRSEKYCGHGYGSDALNAICNYIQKN